MKDFLMLVVFPSKTLDKIDAKKLDNISLYLIFTIIIALCTLPKFITDSINGVEKLESLPIQFVAILLFYFPLVYGSGYCFWQVSKGFKGASSFGEMKNLMVYFTLPYALKAFLIISFAIAGIIKNNAAIITNENYLTNFILWFLSFRIMIVGIAKYNKFNWTITIFTWAIVTTILGGLAFLLQHLKK